MDLLFSGRKSSKYFICIKEKIPLFLKKITGCFLLDVLLQETFDFR